MSALTASRMMKSRTLFTSIALGVTVIVCLIVSYKLWINQTSVTFDFYKSFEVEPGNQLDYKYPIKSPHSTKDYSWSPKQTPSDVGTSQSKTRDPDQGTGSTLLDPETPHFPAKQPEADVERQVLMSHRQMGGELPVWMQDATSPSNKVLTLGSLGNRSDSKFAVFSTTTSNREALGFAFYVPLTVLAWQRLGYRSIVIIVGSVEDWYADEVLHWSLTCAVELGAFIVFLEPREERSVMISQISRLFVANILNTTNFVKGDPYLITSDTDIWPLSKGFYDLQGDKLIVAFNSDCCGTFSHRGQWYKMLPMANIGMRASTWQQVTTKYFMSPNTSEEMITFILKEFGSVAFEHIHKGENLGWYLDQRLVSVLLQEWSSRQASPDLVQYVPRDIGRDRIDRAGWNPQTLQGKTDAHLLETGYIPGVWVQIHPLLELMYGPNSRVLTWCEAYYNQFSKLFLAHFRHQS